MTGLRRRRHGHSRPRDLAQDQEEDLQQAPWIVFGPGAALFVTVVGLNFVGDALRDALDPRLKV